MSLTAADLQAYVSAPTDDEAFVLSCWAEADQLITDRIGPADVPAAIADRARLEVGSELYNRRNAPNGIAQFASPDGSAIRVARDPMVAAYPLLAPYLPLGFA